MGHDHDHSRAELLERLRRHMNARSLKSTAQRQAVVDAFLETTDHVSVEALRDLARERHPGVGQTTVYRTLKLLTDAGVARAHSFGDNATLYEVAMVHHDHMICNECGDIVEFEDQRIEALQDEVAARHGFVIRHHTLELYGVCAECRG